MFAFALAGTGMTMSASAKPHAKKYHGCKHSRCHKHKKTKRGGKKGHLVTQCRVNLDTGVVEGSCSSVSCPEAQHAGGTCVFVTVPKQQVINDVCLPEYPGCFIPSGEDVVWVPTPPCGVEGHVCQSEEDPICMEKICVPSECPEGNFAITHKSATCVPPPEEDCPDREEVPGPKG